ncbi:MAG: hypothetical protein QM820_06115 [Minicystis sp.]
MAEELGLREIEGERRAVEAHERLPHAPRAADDRVRDALLAGAALARDQHGDVAARGARDQHGELRHRRRAQHHRARQRQLAREALVLEAEPHVLGGPRHHREHVGDRAGLAQVVEHAQPERLDDVLLRPVRGDEHDARRARRLAQAAQEAEPVEARHAQIGDHQVVAARGDALERGEAVRGLVDLEGGLHPHRLAEEHREALGVIRWCSYRYQPGAMRSRRPRRRRRSVEHGRVPDR